MTSIKYDVTIPVDWEHDGVKAILNKYNIHLDNDHKGTWISFTTFITKAIDELTKICDYLFIHAYKADKSG